MANPCLADVLGYVRSLVGFPQADQLSDTALLRRFAEGSDEAALVSLLQRHGPLVLTVCRQVLVDPHAAADAFQATFLMLARRAPSIRRWESLSAWLHRVAYRAALRVQAAAARRQLHEREAAVMAKTDEAARTTDWWPLLHAEVDRLPAKYRAPVVLCYLQSRSYQEAAKELGWPIGTVNGRLARARDLLQRRLTRRGVTLAGVPLILAASDNLAAVPAALLNATARAAADFAGSNIAAPAAVSTLAETLLRELAWSRWKLTLSLTLLLAALSAGAATVAISALKGQPAADEPVAALLAEPGPQPARKGVAIDPLPAAATSRLGTTRWRHPDGANFVAFHPQGNLVISGGSNTPEQLRALRSLEVLEHIGTPEAKQLLERLAGGAEGARLTREAKASLKRFAKRSRTP